MSVTWTNLYIDCIGADHYSPESAQCFSALETGLIRVEERWNGHWLRPCVGMRAEQTSHAWTVPSGSPYGSDVNTYYVWAMSLEPRS